MVGLFSCSFVIQKEGEGLHWGKNSIHAQNMEYKLLQSTFICACLIQFIFDYFQYYGEKM